MRDRLADILPIMPIPGGEDKLKEKANTSNSIVNDLGLYVDYNMAFNHPSSNDDDDYDFFYKD